MPLTAQHFTAAASILAVGLGVAAVARTMPSATPEPVVVGVDGGPAAPLALSGCAKACADLGAWCANGRTVNCIDMLTRLEREGAVRCADGISADELTAIGWCGDGGVDMPLLR